MKDLSEQSRRFLSTTQVVITAGKRLGTTVAYPADYYAPNFIEDGLAEKDSSGEKDVEGHPWFVWTQLAEDYAKLLRL